MRAYVRAGLRLDTVTSLCCYGLGPPTRSANARAQAALIPLLRAMLPACTSLEAYDPVFEEDDAAVLRELGCRVLPEHEVSGRRVDAVTLFYMPHCDAELYNDLLDANWSSAAICNVVIIGNSFEHMTVRRTDLMLPQDARRHTAADLDDSACSTEWWGVQERWSGPGRRRVQAKPHRVLAATEHAVVREIALAGDDAPVRNCFNDTSLHWFSRERVKEFEELFRA